MNRNWFVSFHTLDSFREKLDQRGRGRYAFTDASKAHADLEGRGTIGKMLIIPEQGEPAAGSDVVDRYSIRLIRQVPQNQFVGMGLQFSGYNALGTAT
jgi:hypothetical protein